MDFELFQLLICRYCDNKDCKQSSNEILKCDKQMDWRRKIC